MIWLGNELYHNVGKRERGVWEISVIRLNFHILYIPEFGTKRRRNLCTFITYFQVILFTRAVSLHELRFFSKINKYHLYLLSQALSFLCPWHFQTQHWKLKRSWKYWVGSIDCSEREESWVTCSLCDHIWCLFYLTEIILTPSGKLDVFLYFRCLLITKEKVKKAAEMFTLLLALF